MIKDVFRDLFDLFLMFMCVGHNIMEKVLVFVRVNSVSMFNLTPEGPSKPKQLDF